MPPPVDDVNGVPGRGGTGGVEPDDGVTIDAGGVPGTGGVAAGIEVLAGGTTTGGRG